MVNDYLDVLRECSRVYQPHRNDFLILSVVIWMLESLGIVYMNITTVRKYTTVLHEINRQDVRNCDDVKSTDRTSVGTFEKMQ